jgi:hypothetical protein
MWQIYSVEIYIYNREGEGERKKERRKEGKKERKREREGVTPE